MIVKKDGLIKIIGREYPYYTKKQIADIIEEHGAQYFNERGCAFNFRYIGFGEWEITNAE
jgi:hypothetical protein